MTSRLKRNLALGLTAAVASGTGALVLATAATAVGAPYSGSPIGTLTITPASGSNQSAINYTSSGGCPSGNAFTTLLFGAGMPDTGEIVTSKTSAGHSTSGPITSAWQNTPQFYADKNGTTLSGRYDVVLRCGQSLGSTSFGDYRGSLTFSSGTAYTVNSNATPTPTATTAPPTTAPPTTAPPTTAPPTTAPPTTAPPTTAPPTTRPPTTAPPTTAPPTTAPPAGPDTRGYALRISPEYIRVKPGTAITLSTRLVRTDGQHVPGKAVGFYTRGKGGTTFALSRRTTTDDDGLSYGFFTVRADFRFYTNFNLTPTTIGARSTGGLVQVAS